MLTDTCLEMQFGPGDAVTVHNDNGVTFGQLRESIRQALHHHSAAEFHYLELDGGYPVTTKEKQVIEGMGALTWKSDPFRAVEIDESGRAVYS